MKRFALGSLLLLVSACSSADHRLRLGSCEFEVPEDYDVRIEQNYRRFFSGWDSILALEFPFAALEEMSEIKRQPIGDLIVYRYRVMGAYDAVSISDERAQAVFFGDRSIAIAEAAIHACFPSIVGKHMSSESSPRTQLGSIPLRKSA